MEYREFLSLTNEEVKQIVTDIFAAKKVTNIKHSKKWDEITCKIYTEWETTDDNGKEVVDLIPDELTLCDPFKYGEDALHVQFQLKSSDYIQLKQFCIAKGILPDWVKNNPYINKESTAND